jgi:hypothetical protein
MNTGRRVVITEKVDTQIRIDKRLERGKTWTKKKGSGAVNFLQHSLD